MMRLESITVNSTAKKEKIMEALKKNGRGGHYEMFYSRVGHVTSTYYTIFYRVKEVA